MYQGRRRLFLLTTCFRESRLQPGWCCQSVRQLYLSPDMAVNTHLNSLDCVPDCLTTTDPEEGLVRDAAHEMGYKTGTSMGGEPLLVTKRCCLVIHAAYLNNVLVVRCENWPTSYCRSIRGPRPLQATERREPCVLWHYLSRVVPSPESRTEEFRWRLPRSHAGDCNFVDSMHIQKQSFNVSRTALELLQTTRA